MTALYVAMAVDALVLGLISAAYGPWLRRHARPPVGPASPPAAWPEVDVLVMVRNEAAWIEAKIANLAALAYPKDRVRIWIIDGASSDGTADIALGAAAGDARFRVVRFDRGDKTAQINDGLPRCTAPWVMITDADALLPASTLAAMVTVGEADPDHAVIGAPVQPAGGHPLEQLHWRLNDGLRAEESRSGCASIVTGPCYMFRRSLVDRLPDDVVADDVHFAMAAAARRLRVAFIDDAVTELRCPWGLRRMFWHKHRKAAAYLREVIRFLPQTAQMDATTRTIFLWRAGQMTLFPILAVALGLMALAATPLLTIAGAAALVLVARRPRRFPAPVQKVALGALLAAVLFTTIVALPFMRQSASFSKVMPRPAAPPPPGSS